MCCYILNDSMDCTSLTVKFKQCRKLAGTVFYGSKIYIGWPDWAFLQIGLLLEAHNDFKKDEVAQRNGKILGYFLLQQIYSIFT